MKKNALLLVAVVALAASGVVVSACSGTPASADGGSTPDASVTPSASASASASTSSSTSSSATGTSPPPDAGGLATCNTVAQQSRGIPTRIGFGAEDALGGAIGDGTYVLETATYYGVSSISTDAPDHTWVIAGNTVNRVVSELMTDGTTVDTRETMTFTLAGTRMTFSRSCASPKDAPVLAFVDYTATPTSLTVYETLAMGKVKFVLKKK